MLKNTEQNRVVVLKISRALGEMNERAIFVGGATIGFYVNNPAAEDARPTRDVDITVEIATLGELESIRQELVKKGFTQSPEDDVICRFRYENIKVDVMSTVAVGWAPANPWFPQGFAQRVTARIEGHQIQLLPLPHFLASKLAAYNERGGTDPRTSHDLEDIVYVIDNRTDIVDQINNASNDVRRYLQEQLGLILNDDLLQEAILGHLEYETREARYGRIVQCIEQIVQFG
ncbi:nucleotidyl transferase AbiEii/AbiGii toxin family protein [bacterium]|nr:nucleotidyl transferase AbiEii/AbiGii toxin family protein [bacterium]